jgi:hypothetical protein
MNTRRQFFGQMATILAAATAPSILLPKSIDKFTFRANDATKVAVFKKRKLKCVWTCELEQDLMCFYGIDFDQEIRQMMNNMVKDELTQFNILRPNEQFVSAQLTPPVICPSTLKTYRGIIATTQSYV